MKKKRVSISGTNFSPPCPMLAIATSSRTNSTIASTAAPNPQQPDPHPAEPAGHELGIRASHPRPEERDGPELCEQCHPATDGRRLTTEQRRCDNQSNPKPGENRQVSHSPPVRRPAPPRAAVSLFTR